MRFARKPAMAAMGVALATGAMLGTAGTAHAAGMSMTSPQYKSTSGCPCTIGDYHDGTHYKHDAGGKGGRAYFKKSGVSGYTGKVEFHPYNEEIWLYDTRNDNDTVYVRYMYYRIIDGVARPYWSGWAEPKNGRGPAIDASISEGKPVTVVVYDTRGDTSSSIGSLKVTA
ncbi:hypothetical protein ACIBI4_24945 [Streptomyces sp. NPDC050418]|uniref:hypothetical protein n=1 Tax=Streptomyces sp. NPDC050418 TaxID=3365612 RepID=UPI0037A4973A